MSYRRCSHETNIDVRCHSHSPGVHRLAWCADELCDQALFIDVNPEWLGSARELNACVTATVYAARTFVHCGQSATGNHLDGVFAVR